MYQYRYIGHAEWQDITKNKMESELAHWSLKWDELKRKIDKGEVVATKLKEYRKKPLDK